MDENSGFRIFMFWTVVVIAFLVGFTVFFGSWYTIDQGERGVLLRNGAIVDKSVQPGLHFKTPMIDDVEYISVQSNKRLYKAMESYSRDQQPAHFDISVIYHIPPDKVDEVYARYRNEEGVLERLLDRHVYQQAKVVFGGYTALSVIQDRAKFNADVAKAITDAVTNQPIIVEAVNVEDIKFSPDYENAVRLRMIAEVEVQKIKQQAEQQKVTAEITVIKANAEADKNRAEAQGRADAKVMEAKAEAEATRMQGEATAHAIKERGDALAANPELVLLEQAQRWDGKLPSTMLPNSAMPMITLPQAPQAAFQRPTPPAPTLPMPGQGASQ